MLLLLAVVICLLAVHFYRFVKNRPHNFPPGPTRLPIFGNYLQLLATNYRYPYRVLNDLTYKYNSKVLGIFYGSLPAVVICDYEGVKEVSSRPELQGRFSSVITKNRALEQDIGVFFTEGPLWEEQRRFSLRHLRDFGYGRRSAALEDVLAEEISDMLQLLNGLRKDEEIFKDGLAMIPGIFQPGLINSLFVVLFGERFPRKEDSKLRAVSRGATRFVRCGDSTGGFLAQMPWLRHFFPNASGFTDAKEGNDVLLNFLRDAINDNKETFSDEYPRGFNDKYSSKLRQEQASKKTTTFSDDQQLIVALDFMLAAAGSQYSALTFTLVLLLHNPEVQKKVQEEIDAVVGRSRLPTLDDRPSLPYTEATIRESMRRQTLAPLSVLHKSTEDTTFRGYNVPKNTMILMCLWSVHMDKEFWGDPEVFRPERFLDEDGQLKKKDYSLPFGAGKRLCAGETFSRQNIFLFLAGLMQNFTFEMPEGKCAPALDAFVPGLIETPEDFWVRAVPRN